MSLFSDDKFAFPFGESGTFINIEVIDRESGRLIEHWIYKKGTKEEEITGRSLRGFDAQLYQIKTTSITREDYKSFSSRAGAAPLIYKFGRLSLSPAH